MKKGFLLFLAALTLPYLTISGQETYSDNFGSVSYSNNNGTQNFATNWTETGEATSPNNGRIRVTNGGELRFRNLDNRTISRNLDLSAFSSVVLTLDYNRTIGNESVLVQLFDGISYNTVATLDGTGSVNYNLAANEKSAVSSIRFITGSGNWGAIETIFVDNVLFTANILPLECNTIVSAPGAAITDLTTLNSDLSGFAPGTIADVNVTLNITHTWDADLDISLTSPAGTTVLLTSDNGGGGNDYTNTVFDDASGTPITTGSAPFTGTFSPEGNLSDFNEEDPNGIWTLSIFDDAFLDSGTLNSFSIEVCTITPTPTTVITNRKITYRVDN